MAAIGSKDTKPELLVRSWIHRQGLRFRLHRRDLPGTPDLVFPMYKTALFVNGCFWHRHARCRYATMPATNRTFWQGKFRANIARDRRSVLDLRRTGWHVLIIWECELNDRRLRRLAREIRTRPRS
jgi:DNA mismatch endonuclease, patch repair protein